MEENQTTPTNLPKKENKPGLFTLFIGVFLIIRGTMRLMEGEIAVMGILMLAVGIAGVVYYFIKK